MLLEGDSLGSLLNFLTDSVALEARVREAVNVLEEYAATELQRISPTLDSSTPSDDEGDEEGASDKDVSDPISSPRRSRSASVASDSS